ncbi:DUF805 domain-containing protein [Brevundimonas sp.]|uniref:DUF805 domain-containing protein n=1 Tax=Brevundimonas sp. TaxID=1871086 RepID=UPI0025C6C874|nr:DUF805 domain-containing protein [Brevundimonas sp.]
MNWLKDMVRGNLTFSGRLSRRSFYLSLAAFYGIGFLLLPLQLAGAAVPDLLAVNIVLLIIGILMGWYLLGSFVRRLHDRGRSGWWLVCFFGPHVVAISAFSKLPLDKPALVILAMVGAVFLVAPFFVWGLIEILFLRGKTEANRFGPDPLAGA